MFTLIPVAVTVGISTAIDLRTRRIPNAITVPAAASGLAMAAMGMNGVTLRMAILGFLVGMLLMLPGHLLGGTGGGDVKLFAALGTMLGPAQIFVAFVYTAVCGGILAVMYAVGRGRLHATIAGTAQLIARPVETKAEIDAPARGNAFPYGPAIAAGVLLVALGY